MTEGVALDARLAVPAVAAWASAAVALGLPSTLFVAVVAAAGVLAAAAAALLVLRRSPTAVTAAATIGCAAAAMASAGLHGRAARPPELVALARDGAGVQVTLVLTGDPQRLPTTPSTSVWRRPLVRVPARIEAVAAAGLDLRLRAPVVVLAPQEGWEPLLPGQRVTASGRLRPARPGDLDSAVVLIRGPPGEVRSAGVVQRAAGRIRAGLRRAVEVLPAGPAALLPGLVVGDTARLPPDVVDDFRVTGLTHLVAVSGANLAIVVGTVVGLTRRLGAGRRLAGAVAALAVPAFVVVARPSPSVLRAAVMGCVVLAGAHAGRRSSALPALSAATICLVLVDPLLARSAGFALSVLATAGIVVLAVPLRERLPARLPRWLAEALAVPLAAQIACAPLIVAVFGRLSLVAIPANALVAPAVAPATIAGAAAAVVAPVLLPVAHVLAYVAEPPTAWLLLVAHAGAGIPGAQVTWVSGPAGAGLLLLAAGTAAMSLRYRPVQSATAVAVAASITTVGVVSIGTTGWPPKGWAMVACDVGQGDALVLSVGPATAVVVDAGPDPRLVDHCLRDLHVRRVPLVVLSHLHADHVEGLPGVLRHRPVGAVEIGPLDEPAPEHARVQRWAASAGMPVLRAADGERRTVGALSWEVIAPSHAFAGTDSDPNNSSLVLRVTLSGFTALLSGDVELAAQSELLDSGRDVTADVLKVPHHGSNRQLPEFLDRVGERLAVASVGAHNDYGHPAPTTMARLTADGARTFRTDRNGPVAILRRGDAIVAVARHGVGAPPVGVHLAERLPRQQHPQPLPPTLPLQPQPPQPAASGSVTGRPAAVPVAAKALPTAERADAGIGAANSTAQRDLSQPAWARGPPAPPACVRGPPAAGAASPAWDAAPVSVGDPSPRSVAGLTLVVGDEELLVDRAVSRLVAALRSDEPETDVVESACSALAPGDLATQLSPSLFGAARCVVLRDAQDVGKEIAAELLRVLPSVDDAAVVVTHAGGAKGKALLDALLTASVRVVRCAKVTSPAERIEFVVAELRAAGRRIAPDAAAALVTTVGNDLRELATASQQLLDDTEGTVDEAIVARYHRGRADATGFAVADRAVEGDTGGALEVLRWALDIGVAPVLVTSSLAANLRLIAKVAGEGRGHPGRIAKSLGQPTWKVEKAMRWSRGWSPPALSAAVRAVAVADADIKGGAADAGYAVERVVLAVASARHAR